MNTIHDITAVGKLKRNIGLEDEPLRLPLSPECVFKSAKATVQNKQDSVGRGESAGWELKGGFDFGGLSGHQRRIGRTKVVFEGAAGGKMDRRSAVGSQGCTARGLRNKADAGAVKSGRCCREWKLAGIWGCGNSMGVGRSCGEWPSCGWGDAGFLEETPLPAAGKTYSPQHNKKALAFKCHGNSPGFLLTRVLPTGLIKLMQKLMCFINQGELVIFTKIELQNYWLKYFLNHIATGTTIIQLVDNISINVLMVMGSQFVLD
ncbi:uncharacterized protein VP01_2447g1 [Puccinia sorghi]|uniref:Uncharacterized protein n=1 Tax=Puccinia sorghi TaxID=27349 RepID=A0A0L6V811_9BASI|nr:uncharacterized protein VP01_2447g1 [Puccinia sorghi]